MFCIYINLEDCKDRRDYMEMLLDKIKVPYERLNAVRPTMEDMEKIESRLTKLVRYYMKKEFMRAVGVIGCYLSHYQCILRAAELNQKYLIVLEVPSEEKVFFQSKILLNI